MINDHTPAELLGKLQEEIKNFTIQGPKQCRNKQSRVEYLQNFVVVTVKGKMHEAVAIAVAC